MNKTASQKTPLIASFLILLFTAGLFYHLHRKIGENNVLAKENNAKWQEEIRLLGEARLLSRGIEQVKGDASELERHFIKNPDLVPFLDTIEGLAPYAGVTAETRSVELSADKLSLMAGLQAEGSFEAVYKFIRLLENSPYELEFISLDINKVPGQPATWEMQALIKLISFTP